MTIKLGVAGTHSTGKTTFLDTLADQLEARGLRVGRVTDVAREAVDLGFRILQAHTFESTLWIMTRGINLQLQSALVHDVVLVDRPVLDAAGYLYAALETRGARLSWNQESLLFTLAQHDAAGYAMLYKTELDPSIPLGPGRDSDLVFREAAAHHIGAIFDRLGLVPQAVPSEPQAVAELASALERAARVS